MAGCRSAARPSSQPAENVKDLHFSVQIGAAGDTYGYEASPPLPGRPPRLAPPLHLDRRRDRDAADAAVAALVAAGGGRLRADQAVPRLSLRERSPHARAHADRDRQRRGVDAAADAGVDAGFKRTHVRERAREPEAAARAAITRSAAARCSPRASRPRTSRSPTCRSTRRSPTAEGPRPEFAAARDAQFGADRHVRHLLHAEHLLARAVGTTPTADDVPTGTATPLGKEIDPKKAFDRLFAGTDRARAPSRRSDGEAAPERARS